MTDQTPDSANPPAQPSPKWFRVLLVVSLTFNLLVIGLVAGAKWGERRAHGFDPHGPNRGAIRDLGFAPLASALDRADRRQIGKALREQGGSFAAHRQQLAAEFQAMLVALRADPFDPDGLLTIMEQQSERMRNRGEFARTLFVDHIAKMTSKERLDFADRVERSVRKRDR